MTPEALTDARGLICIAIVMVLFLLTAEALSKTGDKGPLLTLLFIIAINGALWWLIFAAFRAVMSFFTVH